MACTHQCILLARRNNVIFISYIYISLTVALNLDFWSIYKAITNRPNLTVQNHRLKFNFIT